MKNTFKELVRKGACKSPVQFAFSLSGWRKEWANSLKTQECLNLYEAGIEFYDVLSEIRDRLSKLYKDHAPNLTNSEALRAYCAAANRDRHIATKISTSSDVLGRSVFSATFGNNPLGNRLTLMEICDGSLDGMQKAIFFCGDRIRNNKSWLPGTSPHQPIDFIREEATLSHLYVIYEQYWQALLWGDYEFTWLDRESETAKIVQLATKSQVAYEVSNIRRARLDSNIVLDADRIMHFIKGKYVSVVGSGKSKRLISKEIQTASEELRIQNAIAEISFLEAANLFPKSFLENEHFPEKITLRDIFSVFRIFVLMSIEAKNKFPENDSAHNLKKLFEFCPAINEDKLRLVLMAAADLNREKVERIIEFLTYEELDNDIWCHPLVRSDDGRIFLLTAALCGANYLRVIEHWLVRLDVDLSAKGYVYEGRVVELLNVELKKNHHLADYDLAVSKRIKLSSGQEEEIDLLFRIGSLIVVGEAKSIISTNSPAAFFRTIEILNGASSQAIRKLEFVRDNLEDVMNNLGWDFTRERCYEFTSLIINSNRMHAGFSINGVPVCDEKILISYFQKTKFPIFSTFANSQREDLAWIETYASEGEMIKLFPAYLDCPPQISEDANSFVTQPTTLPCLSEASLKLSFQRLVPKNISFEERLSKPQCVPVKTVDDLGERLSKVDLVI